MKYGYPIHDWSRLLIAINLSECKETWEHLELIGTMIEKDAQRPKKVVSDNQGLVDFAIGLVNSAFNLSSGQVIFFKEFE